jgi:CHAT domain-containing protein/Tfp pilus assembly protein PilF
VTLRVLLVVALLAAAPRGVAPGQSSASTPRALTATIPIHDVLGGGERAAFTFNVPENTAARVTVIQEGIDVAVLLRRSGAATPAHRIDLVAGTRGEEHLFPAISDAAASWEVVVSASLPRAARAPYTIALETSPADDRARAVAAAREIHYRAAQPAAVGDAETTRREEELYAAAGRGATAAGDPGLAAECTYQVARHRDVLGDTPGALETQKRALEMFRGIGRTDREGRVLNRLGDLSRKLGDVAEAERYFEQALPLSRAAEDAEAIADILNNSALLLLSLGRYDEAIERLQAAIPLAQEIDSANVEAALSVNLGTAYYALGDFERSVEHFRRATEVAGRMKAPRRVGRAQHGLARAFFARGDRQTAEQTIQGAIRLLEQADDKVYIAEALGSYGEMRLAAGDALQAVDLFARAQPMLHDARHRSEASVLAGWAEANLARGDIDGALARSELALQYARQFASPSLEAAALAVRARALEARGSLADAAEAIGSAVRVVENTRGTLQRTDLRTSYLATVHGYYDLYVDLLQRQGRTADAFEVSERSRARTLLEGLAQSAGKIEKGIDPGVLARRRGLQSQIEAKENYRAQLALQAGKGPQAEAAARDVAALKQRLAGIEEQIRASSPDYWALQSAQPIDARRVQETLLDADTALVEYHVGRERSYAWVVDRSSITAYTLPAAAAIEGLARRYHEAVSRDPGTLAAAARAKRAADVQSLGKRLAAAVWVPVAPRVSGKRVLVVADGALQYVPFAALSPAGTPLLARQEIVYLPSVSVLEPLRRAGRRVPATGVSAAVFADPVFSRNDSRFGAARDAAADARSRAADGGSYGRLRFSRREAEAIAAISPGVFQALDFSASKSSVLARDLRRYRIIHFATHGALNTQRPELSGLVLSLVDRGGKPQDGFLRLHEIYNLDLDADLVVLSACRTALGKDVHGEGLIGLTRGFLYAGASRVVSSVWNVDDRASAELMKRFYEAMLVRKQPPAAALRAAQLSLLNDPRWADPHYWAAFGLFGEPK